MRKLATIGVLFCMIFAIFFTGLGSFSTSANNVADNVDAFTQYKTTMQKGQVETFAAKVDPANADSVRWTVSDPNVLTLSNNKGSSVQVAAVKEGKAIIAMNYGNGSNGGGKEVTFPEPPSGAKILDSWNESENGDISHPSLYVKGATNISGSPTVKITRDGYFNGTTSISGSPNKMIIGNDAYFNNNVDISGSPSIDIGRDAHFFRKLTISGTPKIHIKGDAYFLDDITSGKNICVDGTVYYKKNKPVFDSKCTPNFEKIGEKEADGNKSAQITVTVVEGIQSEIGLNGTVDPKQQTIEKPKNEAATGTVNIQLTPYGKPAVSELTREPVDLVFVIDKSGSMSQKEDKMSKAKEAAKHAVDILLEDNSGSKNVGDRIGLVSFDTTAKKLNDLTDNQGQPNFTTVKNTISKIIANGGTNYWAALNMANSMFSADTKRKYIIFLTDGVPTHGKNGGGNSEAYIQKAQRDAEEAAGGLAKNSIKLYSIGFGKDVRMNNLERLSSLTGGTAYEGTMDNLNSLFAQITREIKQISLGEVKIKVKLPSSDVQLAPDSDAIVDEAGYIIVNFPDIPIGLDGPIISEELQANLVKKLQLKFNNTKTYTFDDIKLMYNTLDNQTKTKNLPPVTINVISKGIPVQGIELDKQKLTLEVIPDEPNSPKSVGEVTVRFIPEDATNKNVTWEIKDPSIAKFTPDGTNKIKITAKRPGKTEIIVTAEEKGKEGQVFTESCTIHVNMHPKFSGDMEVVHNSYYAIVKPQLNTVLPSTHETNNPALQTRWYVLGKDGQWGLMKDTATDQPITGYFDRHHLSEELKVDGKTPFAVWAVTVDKKLPLTKMPGNMTEDEKFGERKPKIQEVEKYDIQEFVRPINAGSTDSSGDNRAATISGGYKVVELPSLVKLKVAEAEIVLKDASSGEKKLSIPLDGVNEVLDTVGKQYIKTKLIKAPDGKTVKYRVFLKMRLQLESGEFDMSQAPDEVIKEVSINEEIAPIVVVKGKNNLR
ncbi:VWA domain-containing protein [Aneurinibacillus aneurinilyticus]|uniref:VWA domain-containing protein n=1 Tax=Aneurinibacillus aneurinilyticus TaxID=1391 RepID=UPI0035247CA1